jgi:uncharacterized membrane-anchored protein YjiN (DUF445 family)
VGNSRGLPQMQRVDESSKLADLRRMQWVALASLGLLPMLLVISIAYRASAPWLPWVRAFAEAGIAGAIADWYAVVALFRRPLGLPLPHTAIIPNNKDRIADSIGAFIELNFLTGDNVIRKMTQLDVASRISKWLSDAKNSRDLADTICDAIPATLNMMDDSKIRDFWRKILGAQFRSVNATCLLDQLLDVVTAKRLHRKFLGGVLASLEEWISSNRSVIKAKVAQASRFTPGFIDGYVANRFVDGLILLISEMAGDTDRRFGHNLTTQ